MKKAASFFMIFVVAALMAVPASAQDFVEFRLAPYAYTSPPEFKIYEIKHQKADDIAKLLTGFLIDISVNTKFNTISLSAVSEVHGVISSIIQKYDIPDVPKRTVELQFFLVRTSNSDELGEAVGINTGSQKYALPEKVLTALNEIASLTRFKSFVMIGAPFVRILESSYINMSGQSPDNYIRNFQLNSIAGVTIREDSNKRQIRIDRLNTTFSVFQSPEMYTYRDVGISASLEFAEDEVIVVGTTQILGENDSDSAIIVIVTAKII